MMMSFVRDDKTVNGIKNFGGFVCDFEILGFEIGV